MTLATAGWLIITTIIVAVADDEIRRATQKGTE